MPKVTEIAPQKKRTDRYSIYVDEQYAFSLGDLDLINSGLREGAELSEQEIEDHKKRSLYGKALDRAYYYLSYRPRTEQEARTYLKGKDYDDDLVEAVIQRLVEQKYLNDTQFAELWVAERSGGKARSKLALRQELRQKGINADIIEAVLGEVSGDDEVTSIKELINSKRLVARYDSREKLMRYLATQGFSYDQIKRALEGLESVD